MFTTQQMIERRTRDRSFAQATEFHFKGRPRLLRIWDESLVPAEGLVLGADQVAHLPAFLQSKLPAQAALVRSFVLNLWGPEPKTQVVVPEEFGDLPTTVAKADSPLKSTIDTLRRLAGRPVSLVEGWPGGIQLAGSSLPLPADFAPVIILDASGRVRATYDVWERELRTLRRLPSAANDYSRLKVHLWERPVGQTSFLKPSTMDEIVDAVAEAIKGDPASDWLIVSYKNHPVDEALRAAVPEDARLRLNFLTWGMHHGTNAFAHCTNIVLVGHLTYGSAAYTALASAVGLSSPHEAEGIEEELKAGEYRHGYLQALTRASVRRSVNGVAGKCTAYVIASPGISRARRHSRRPPPEGLAGLTSSKGFRCLGVGRNTSPLRERKAAPRDVTLGRRIGKRILHRSIKGDQAVNDTFATQSSRQPIMIDVSRPSPIRTSRLRRGSNGRQ